MKPTKVSNGDHPRVHVIPDENKIFESDYMQKTYYAQSADFVDIDKSVAEEIASGDLDALDRILIQDPENPVNSTVLAGKVQLNCVDGVIRYIANRRIREVYP